MKWKIFVDDLTGVFVRYRLTQLVDRNHIVEFDVIENEKNLTWTQMCLIIEAVEKVQIYNVYEGN